jgi:hypothetical protein
MGDVLASDFENAADNTNPALLIAELNGTMLELVFDPAEVGSALLTVHARDLAGQTVSNTFSVRVMAPPVAVDDFVTTLEDVPVEIAVYSNDFDSDGVVMPSTVRLVADTGPSFGTVTLHQGVFVYTPFPNYFGTDSFRYTIRDNDGFFSNEALVTITVIEVPDYHNVALPADVNNSGNVSPVDVLILINYINQVGFELPPAPMPPATPPYYYDVDGDGFVTPKDVILVVNYLNRDSQPVGEGEWFFKWASSITDPRVEAPAAPNGPESSASPPSWQRPSSPEQMAPDTSPSRIEPGLWDAVFHALGTQSDRDFEPSAGDLLDDLFIL